MGRPRLPAGDPGLEHRRRQYRASKRRARGLDPSEEPPPAPEESTRRHVAVLVAPGRWAPAYIDHLGRRIL